MSRTLVYKGTIRGGGSLARENADLLGRPFGLGTVSLVLSPTGTKMWDIGTKLPRTVTVCPPVTQTPFRQTPCSQTPSARGERPICLADTDRQAYPVTAHANIPKPTFLRPVLLLSLAGSADRRERLDRASVLLLLL